MLEDLLKAISTRWDSDAGAKVRQVCPGNLHFTKAPAGVQDDNDTYCVYSVLPGTVAQTNTTQIEEARVTFSIYATDEDEQNNTAWAARDALVQVYDNALLGLENDDQEREQRMIQARRLTNGQVFPDPEKGWFCVLEYLFMVVHED